MKIRSVLFGLFLAVLLVAGTTVFATQQNGSVKLSRDKAQRIALDRARGTVESAELEHEKGTMVWSFDIRTGDRSITEVLVDANSGAIVDVQKEDSKAERREKDEQHDAGKRSTSSLQPKLTEVQARQIAVARASGTVESAELEHEKNTLVWSFDIRTAEQGITEVLVNANDGRIVDVHQESPGTEAAEQRERP